MTMMKIEIKVVGATGVGKTRLLKQILEEVLQSQFAVKEIHFSEAGTHREDLSAELEPPR